MITPVYIPDTQGLLLWAVLTAIALVSFVRAARRTLPRDTPDRKVDA